MLTILGLITVVASLVCKVVFGMHWVHIMFGTTVLGVFLTLLSFIVPASVFDEDDFRIHKLAVSVVLLPLCALIAYTFYTFWK